MITQLENMFDKIFYTEQTAKEADKELSRLLIFNNKEFMISLNYSKENSKTSQVNVLYVSGIKLMEGVTDQDTVRKSYNAILQELKSYEVPFEEYAPTLKKYRVTKQDLINGFERDHD